MTVKYRWIEIVFTNNGYSIAFRSQLEVIRTGWACNYNEACKLAISFLK